MDTLLKTNHWILVILIGCIASTFSQQVSTCPPRCSCRAVSLPHLNLTAELTAVNCSGRGLTALPDILPHDTQYLDVSNNAISAVADSALDSALGLRVVDLRGNPGLTRLPALWSHTDLAFLLVDAGAACCMYETEWRHGSQAQEAPATCLPTEPYHECDRRLVKVISIVIYGIVGFSSLLFNPWVLLVTVGYRPRRQDPITLNSANFSVSNLLLTFYALTMFIAGIKYFNTYHRHMESWLSNPVCSVAGYFLITSTLAASVFYMLEVLMIYQKLRFPLHTERHMTSRQLCLAVGAVWAGALLVGAVPFMTSTEGRYNRVGLCLPFYSGDYKFGFKYVFLYTTITNVMVAVIIVLAVLLLRSLVRTRENWYGDIPKKVAERNRMLEKMVLTALVVYLLINLANVAFLVMSCVGGRVGQLGREWFSRLAVIEAVTNPLVGPLRKKQFYRDTRRCLVRWGVVRWDRFELSETSSSMVEARRRVAERNESRRRLQEESPAHAESTM